MRKLHWMMAMAGCSLLLGAMSGAKGGVAVPPLPAEERPEVLTRGPVHEAFARPVILKQEEGLLAPRRPPADLSEDPPDERPLDSGAVWVPGYWSWDADWNDFVWVSGCWRIAPPNTYWVPGYWTPMSDGWQWVAGFWATTSTPEIVYLPAPPAIADLEPPEPAAVADRLWVPPCYYWIEDQYVLRRGYWLAPQPNWVWVPSHYVWTPRGYVFVPGHWDYRLDRRGVLFAPVRVPRALYLRPRYVFSPTIVLDIGPLTLNLFAYPRYRHFFFGDYYDTTYLRLGIYPRFECVRLTAWYDPIYVHDRWSHRRSDPRWDDRERREYERRRDDRDLRPPRTYREMETRLLKVPETRRPELQIAQPLRTLVTDRSAPFRFERVDSDTRKRITERTTEMRRFGEERNRWEGPAVTPRPGPSTPDRPEPVRPSGEVRGPRPGERDRPTTPPTVRVTQPERVQVPPGFRTERWGPSRPDDEDRGRDDGRGRGDGRGGRS
jgi:hypothetical protein